MLLILLNIRAFASLYGRKARARAEKAALFQPSPFHAMPARYAGLEELLDEAALFLDAGDYLLHEIAGEGGTVMTKVGLDSLEVDRDVAQGRDAAAPRVDEVERHADEEGDVEAGGMREGMVHGQDDEGSEVLRAF